MIEIQIQDVVSMLPKSEIVLTDGIILEGDDGTSPAPETQELPSEQTKSEKRYAKGGAKLLAEPFREGAVLRTLSENEELTVEITSWDYWVVHTASGDGFIYKEDALVQKIAPAVVPASRITPAQGYTPQAGKLTARKGVHYGPTGKETYYNLPMGGVIRIMRRMGNQDAYWVREDGVKMLGKYVMVAANLDRFPRGSLVPTSLGMGIVCDTGTFALYNPTQLDIAVNW